MTDEPLVIPAALLPHLQRPGTWSKYLRILLWGKYKTGKSFFLADFPKPILAATGGDEAGLAQYLDPKAGDMCFSIDTPDNLKAFLEFGSKNVHRFKSMLFDPIGGGIWEDYMDSWNEQLGGDIKGSQWRQVKGPWKLFMRQMKRAKLHVGMSAHMNDTLYEEVENAPGEKKLSIKAIEAPKIERKTPYHVDLIFQTLVKLDKKNKPTPFHQVIFMGGRRPRTIPPNELYVGKTWEFDSRVEQHPWKTVIEPILDKWQEGGSEDYIGALDGAEIASDMRETAQIAEDAVVGSMLRVIESQTNLHEYASKAWPDQIAPFINGLTDERVKSIVMAAHEAKKKELTK